ncbi:unnamed protein product [Sphagnum troendelagicum]|uniref:Zinc finger CHCC-type domain-containing protein n=2 Tax=Sphagnum TaxID=13804 RepID=A0ABP0UAB0_9BRYO
MRTALDKVATATPSNFPSSPTASSLLTCELFDDHTAKWMQSTDKKSPMELISEVPVIEVDARVVACEGGRDPALGHPIEYICLDGDHPAVCKYCGLRYSLRDAHGHH